MVVEKMRNKKDALYQRNHRMNGRGNKHLKSNGLFIFNK